MDIGCLQFQLEEAFLMKLDSEKIETEIREKIIRGEPLTEEEQMEFIILPLTYRGNEKKQECIKRCFEMAKEMDDEQNQRFMLSGLLVFTDKVIKNEDSERIREWIMMTKVGRLLEEEKLAYAKQQVEEATRAKEEEFAEKMLAVGESVEKIMEIVSILTREDILKIEKEMTSK